MEEMKRKLLKLDLQHFGGNSEGEGNQGEGEGQQGEPQDKQGENLGENHEGESGKGGEPKTFTQAELDAIIADRLARERRKQEEKAEKLREEEERKRLEEQEEYKELAKKLQEELDKQKADALEAKRLAALSSAGYDEKQIELFKKLVEGETDEEIKASIDVLKTTVPPTQKQYADPGIGNGHKQEPKKKDLHEQGRTIYQRLKEKGKIRR